MPTYFYDKKCTVYSVSKTKVDGSEKYQETAVYTGIPCDFWLGSGDSADAKISRDMKDAYYTVDLQPAYTNIQKGNRIALIDVVNGNDIQMGMFEVVSVEFFKDINNNLDNVRVKVYPRNI